MTTYPRITVIGAGIIGCAVAYELGRRGAAVTVLERRDVALGATQASAGMLAPFIEAHHGGPLRALGVRSLELYDRFISDVVADSRPVSYYRTGTLEVATDDAMLGDLAAVAHQLSSEGVDSELLDAVGARRAEPHLSADVAGALLVPAQGFVAAAALAQALREAAVRHGVIFRTASAASGLRPVNGHVEVTVDDGEHTADAVVIATGSWTGALGIDGIQPPPVRPVRGQLLQLDWTGDPLSRVIFAPRCYVVPWENGAVLVGATEEEVGFDERATAGGVAELLDAIGALLPASQAAGFEEVRVGLRPGTPDDLPVLGRAEVVPNVIYATGHYRNGVLLAPVTAQLIADLVLDDQEDALLVPFTPARFHTT